MSGDGVNFSEKLARDVKTATGLVLGNRGNETVQAFGRTNVRQTRFYKAPGGGIAAPSNSTTPSSATCTLMKWNSAGTALEVTNTTETVYSFSAYAADSIFQAKQVGGKIFADPASGDFEIPAAPLILNNTDSGIFDNDITTTKAVFQLQLQDTSSIWIDYWELTASGSTAGNMNIKLAGAYIVNLPFNVYTTGTKGTQVELSVVGGSNIFAYTTDTPSDINVELWAVDAGNTTWPGSSGDGVLLDKWKNLEPQVGLSVNNGANTYRGGILTSMFESEVDDFELQVWHYEANNTTDATNFLSTRSGGWILKLPNSIDTTFDGTDLGSVTP